MSLLTTDTLCQKIYSKITSTVASQHLAIHLGIIMVGNHLASLKFVASERKKPRRLATNAAFSIYLRMRLPANLGTNQSIECKHQHHWHYYPIALPAHLDGWAITNTISPDKDVDCLTSTRMGSFLTNCHTIMPGTAQAISYLCDHYQIRPKEKCHYYWRINIGRQTSSHLVLKQNTTVTICHEHTMNLEEIVEKCRYHCQRNRQVRINR